MNTRFDSLKWSVRYDDAAAAAAVADPAAVAAAAAAAAAAAPPITQSILDKALANLVSKELPKVVQAQTKELKDLIEGMRTRVPDPAEAQRVLDEAAAAARVASGQESPAEKASRLQYERSTADLNTKLAAMAKQNEEIAARAEAVEKRAAIEAELSTFTFVKPESRAAAYRLLESEVQKGTDGSYGGDGLPLKAFIQQEMTTKYDNLITVPGANGTGARGGSAAMAARGGAAGKEIQLSDLKPGMSDATFIAAGKQIQKVLHRMGVENGSIAPNPWDE